MAALVGAVIGTVVTVLATGVDTSAVAPRVAAPAGAGPAVVEGEWAPPAKPAAAAKPPVDPASFVVADATVPQVQLWAAPGQPLGTSLANPTWEGLDVVFLVLERRTGWLRVRVSSRPNGMTAWVQAKDVALRRVPNRIKVEVGARRLTVFHGDSALLSTVVVVGRDSTPTPVGSFFVDGAVVLDPPDSAYGSGQLSVSGFSPTLTSFGGGVGQIALHGTFATGLLGTAASNGCVRIENGVLRQLMGMAPTGTPVEIVA